MLAAEGVFWQRGTRAGAAHPTEWGGGMKRAFPRGPLSTPCSLSGLPPSQAGPMGRAHVLEGASVISSRCLLLTVRLWASYLTFLCSVFSSLKWGKNTTYLTGKLHG